MKRQVGSTGRKTLLAIALAACQTVAFALPSLQFGADPSDTSMRSHEGGKSWLASGTGRLKQFAYANCDSGTAGCDRPDGEFDWNSDGEAERYPRLLAAANHDSNNDSDDGDAIPPRLGPLKSGGSTFPSSSQAGTHSQSKVYSHFSFGGFRLYGHRGPVEPDDQDSGDGHKKRFGVIVKALLDDDEGGDFDLFPGERPNRTERIAKKELGEDLAPCCRDKEPMTSVAEPGTLALMGIGLVGIAALRRRKL